VSLEMRTVPVTQCVPGKYGCGGFDLGLVSKVRATFACRVSLAGGGLDWAVIAPGSLPPYSTTTACSMRSTPLTHPVLKTWEVLWPRCEGGARPG